MNEEIVKRVIQYLEGIQTYAMLLERYFSKEDMDDFDQCYLELYMNFEDFVEQQLYDSDSAIVHLTKHYQEFLVDYKESLLFHCLEAINRGHERRHIYNEGKRDVYLRYLHTMYGFDAKDLLNRMNDEEFEEFENKVFDDMYIKKVINKSMT